MGQPRYFTERPKFVVQVSYRPDIGSRDGRQRAYVQHPGVIDGQLLVLSRSRRDNWVSRREPVEWFTNPRVRRCLPAEPVFFRAQGYPKAVAKRAVNEIAEALARCA